MKAELIEEKAEYAEAMLEELEDLALDLQQEIPEIRRLEWF